MVGLVENECRMKRSRCAGWEDINLPVQRPFGQRGCCAYSDKTQPLAKSSSPQPSALVSGVPQLLVKELADYGEEYASPEGANQRMAEGWQDWQGSLPRHKLGRPDLRKALVKAQSVVRTLPWHH